MFEWSFVDRVMVFIIFGKRVIVKFENLVWEVNFDNGYSFSYGYLMYYGSQRILVCEL